MKPRKQGKVVALTKAPPRPHDDPREKRITALVQMLAVAHQIARRKLAEERSYAA